MIGIERSLPNIEPVILFTIKGFPIASSTVTAFLLVLIIGLFSYFKAKKFKVEKPTNLQIFFEMFYEQILEIITQNTGGNKKRAEKIVGIAGALLIYITLANIIGLIPVLIDLKWEGNSIFSSPTADFNTPIGLAVGSMIAIHFASIKQVGLWGYFNRFIKIEELFKGFRKGIGKGFLAIIDVFIGLLDIVGELAKIISVTMRLFGNLYAGGVMTIVILGMIAYIIPAVWLGMSLFVSVIQALVFTSIMVVHYSLTMGDEETESLSENKDSKKL